MINPLDLTGRSCLVTGASSGIGRETAVLLSRLGAKVILVARRREGLEKTLSQMEGSGHTVEPLDLADYESIPNWLRVVAQAHGPIDAIVHSAGIHLADPLKTMEAQAVERMWKVNVSAALWLAKGFRHRSVNNAGGSLVLIASAAGLAGQAAHSAYSASKGAIISATRSLAAELAREKIRVNCIAPGMVVTSMSKEFEEQLSSEALAGIEKEHMLGLGQPLDVAHAIAFLVSPASRWITGSTMVVDGGYTAH